MSSPIYVAIDTPDLTKAQLLAQQVRNHVGGLKLGLEFFCANGHHGVREMMKFDLLLSCFEYQEAVRPAIDLPTWIML